MYNGSAIGASAIGSSGISLVSVYVDFSLDSSYGVNIDGTATGNASIDIQKVFLVTFDEESEVYTEIDVSSVFDITVDEFTGAVVDILLNNTHGISSSGEADTDASIDIQKEFFIQADETLITTYITLPDGRILYVVVQKERVYSIEEENRQLYINDENRTLKIR